jgi:hypothetical protein
MAQYGFRTFRPYDNNSSVGNTTRLGMGGGPSGGGPRDSRGRYTARRGLGVSATLISKEVSRQNMRDAVKERTDPRLNRIRRSLLKLVINWSYEHKIRLINEFGDHIFLGKNPTIERINEQVVESLILNSEESEINELLGDVKVVEERFEEVVQEARREIKERFIFTTRTLDPLFARIKNNNKRKGKTNYLKGFFSIIRREETGARRVINKNLQSRYRGLRREILAVLNNMLTKIEIAQLAVKMNIEFSEITSRNELYESIAAKVIMYVDLIVRRSGGRQEYGFSNSIIDVEPYNTILQYTSHSYVAGRSGLNQKDLKEIRDKANRAREMMRQANYGRLNFVQRIFAQRASRYDPSFTGQFKFSDLKRGMDVGILANMSIEEVIELAAKYGISYKRNTPIHVIKTALYGKIIFQNRRERILESKINRARDSGRMPNPGDIAQLEQIRAFKKKNEEKYTVPIIEFAKDGVMKTSDILKAVPVYVMNNLYDNLRKNGLSGQFDTDSEDAFLRLTNLQIAKRENISIWEQVFGEVTRRRNQVKAQRDSKIQQKMETLSDFGRDVPIVGFAGTIINLEELKRVVPVYVVNNNISQPSGKGSSVGGPSISGGNSSGYSGPYLFEDLMSKAKRNGNRHMVWQGKLYEQIFGPGVVQIVPHMGDPEGMALFWHGDYKSDGSRKYTYEPKLAVNKSLQTRIPFHDPRSKAFSGFGKKRKLSPISSIMSAPYSPLFGNMPGSPSYSGPSSPSPTGSPSTPGTSPTGPNQGTPLAPIDYMRQFNQGKKEGRFKNLGIIGGFGLAGTLLTGGIGGLAAGGGALAYAFVNDKNIRDNLEIFENYKRILLTIKETKKGAPLDAKDSDTALTMLDGFKINTTFFRAFVSWMWSKDVTIDAMSKLSSQDIEKPLSIYVKENNVIKKNISKLIRFKGFGAFATITAGIRLGSFEAGSLLAGSAGIGILAATGSVAVGVALVGANVLRQKSRVKPLLNRVQQFISLVKSMAPNNKIEEATTESFDNALRLMEARDKSGDLNAFVNWANGVMGIPRLEFLNLNQNRMEKLIVRFLKQDNILKEFGRKVIKDRVLPLLKNVITLGLNTKSMERSERRVSNKRLEEFRAFKVLVISSLPGDPSSQDIINLAGSSKVQKWIYSFLNWAGARGVDAKSTMSMSDIELIKLIEEYTKSTSNRRKIRGFFDRLFGIKPKVEKGKDASASATAGVAQVVTTEGLLASVIFPINPLDPIMDLSAGNVVRVFDVSKFIDKPDEKKSSRRGKRNKKSEQDKSSSFLSLSAMIMGINSVKSEAATPVFVVNKALPTDIAQIFIEVAKLLTRFIDPTGATGEVLGASLKSIAGTSTGTVRDLVDKLATGGTGKSYSKKTHFISGDSLTKKPNPEQVSIDWTKKSFSVKPIPQFAEGGSMAESSPNQIRRMTMGDRNKPMSVGISSHLVTYERTLTGAKDNGNKEALKVFSVNPGIADVIDVDGKNVSLIGLVADMTQRLTNIEALLSVNNEQNQAIVAATATTAANTVSTSSNAGGAMNPFVGTSMLDDLSTVLKGR